MINLLFKFAILPFRLINYLRGYIETIGAILIFAAFLYGIIFLHIAFTVSQLALVRIQYEEYYHEVVLIFVQSNLSWVVKVKCITGYIATVDIVLLFYMMGQNFENLVIFNSST